MENFEPTWRSVLADEFEKPYFNNLLQFVKEERKAYKIYPPEELVFNAFFQTRFDQVKVVIIGQDPYHGEGQAHGLCFSVSKGVKLPPSLKNIFKELESDLNLKFNENGNLTKWAQQGVLLLNTTLTVREGNPLSHAKKGWEEFTDAVVAKLAASPRPLVFLLWGNHAREKYQAVAKEKINHLVLTAAHPSPFSATKFLGCRHFSKTNQFLESQGLKPIDWQI